VRTVAERHGITREHVYACIKMVVDEYLLEPDDPTENPRYTAVEPPGE